ncbi:hypothetical protein PUN28_017213 [Cardiocondyla obscurior]|uniref:Uncharacterized protein n=1 Tax=Cardiocondyla obscurior TaxID=286306 RepID=A0AAW2EMF3_9HYME
MNRLKHICEISARASSNIVLSPQYGQRANVRLKKYKLKSRLLPSNPLSSANKSYDVGIEHSKRFRQDSLQLVSNESKTICRQRAKTKSSVTSLRKKSSAHKKLPSGSTAKRFCHYSTCRNAEFIGKNNERFTLQNNAILNDLENINRCVASVEKNPRSYAEMIAEYSESLYKKSAVARSDRLHFDASVRRSPSSAFSAPAPIKKIVNAAKYSEQLTESRENDFSLPVKSPNRSASPEKYRGTQVQLIKSKKQEEKSAVSRKWSYLSNEIDTTGKRKTDFEPQKHNYSHSSDGIPYLRHLAAESSAVRKNSTHKSTNAGEADVQPQVKLRMVPSEKESVVSINVNENEPLDSPSSISKHLSVVVQSDRKQEQLSDAQQSASAFGRAVKSAPPRNDFGPMHISISENSAPVKQIEFSINGKPVSELRSITARTERLDVVSSADKVEIRVPFAKGNANANKTRELSKGVVPNVGQILNVQISASFRNESTRSSSVETSAKATRHDSTPKPSSISKAPYLSSFPGELNDKKNVNQASLIRGGNNVEAERLNAKKVNTESSEASKYDKNEPSDRVPSKIIPWWSSSDSFNKIRKKGDDKSLVPPLNQNDRRESSKNKNLTTETLLPKEMSNLKKKTQSTNLNDTAVKKSDSSNTTSRSNNIKLGEELKATTHYACSFRLKSNRENPGIVPKIVKNDSKNVENRTTTTANKDINKISQDKSVKISGLLENSKQNNSKDLTSGKKSPKTVLESEKKLKNLVSSSIQSKSLPLQDYEKKFNKSMLSEENLSRSACISRKPSDSIGLKSGSKIKSMVMSNNNFTYDRKLRVGSFDSNFNRKMDMSNSQSVTFEPRQSLKNVNALEHLASTAIECGGSWINTDRPEKNILYSVWLQRSAGDNRNLRFSFIFFFFLSSRHAEVRNLRSIARPREFMSYIVCRHP